MNATLLLACISLVLAALAMGYWAGATRARAATAAPLAELELLRASLEPLRRERDTALADASTAKSDLSAARAQLEASLDTVTLLRVERDAERQTAIREGATREEAQRELAEVRTKLEQREQSLAEQRALLEKAELGLKDAFKATGADVLRETADSFMKQAREHFDQQQKLGSADLEQRRAAVDNLVQPLRDELRKQEQLVRELTEKREGDSKALSEQLRSISQLQVDTSKAAQSLSGALRDNRQRGRWGEVSLRNLVEMAGLVNKVDFIEQLPVDGAEGQVKPDMVVNLPGGRTVPVDSKVPMAAYLDSLGDQVDDARRRQLRAAHAAALRTHVRALASRDYAKKLGSEAGLTVLFVPLESGLIAALEEDVTLYNDALQLNIVITTASTLLALLRICALQWHQAALGENAKKIGDSTRELLARIETFAGHLTRVRKGLTAASTHFNAAIGSFNTRLLPQARRAAELAEATTLLPGEMEPVQAFLNSADVDEVEPEVGAA